MNPRREIGPRVLPELARRLARAEDRGDFLRGRRAGRWEGVSTHGLAADVRELALGLAESGVRRGDCMALLAAPSPFWVEADLAVQTAGGVTTPLFPNASEEGVQAILRDSGAAWLVLDEPETLPAGAAAAAAVEHVVYRGAWRAAPAHAVRLEDVLRRGRTADARDPARYDRLVDALRPGDLATLIYTSGSTGEPKGVELTHDNLLSQTEAAARRFPLAAGRDTALSLLPLAHVFERMIVYFYLRQGVAVTFGDDVRRAGDLLREVRPTVLTAVPRLLEKMHERMLQAVADAPGWKGQLARRALQAAGASAPPVHGVLRLVFDRLVYRRLRRALGGRARVVVCGGAALPVPVHRFFLAIGVPVYCGYGLTEASPVIATAYPGVNRPGAVGPPFPGVEVSIASGGEILARGRGIMRGYRGRPEEMRQTVDEHGWLHTGDLGRLDGDGQLVLTGRCKDLCKTSTGKYVAPAAIEDGLRHSPLIDSALVVAEGRKYVVAILFLDAGNVERLRARLAPAQSLEAFVESEPLRARLDAAVEAVNRHRQEWEHVRRYAVSLDPPTIENGLLTPTVKLRRRAVTAQYAEAIEGLYAAADKEHAPL